MSLRPRTEVRRNRYKVAVDAEKGRRRREDNMVEIRKTQKEENMQKKRREGTLAQQSQPAVNVPQFDKKLDLESLPATMSDVWSHEPALQFGATVLWRKLLSKEGSPPISEVIQSGVVPRFVEFLARDDCPPLQFEAAWALTNIASGTAENMNVVLNALPAFLGLLHSPMYYVRLQAVWGLGIIVGHSAQSRDLALSYGALGDLLPQLTDQASIEMLQNATWTLSNLCRGHPPPQFEQVRPMLPALTHLIRMTDVAVLKSACWALSYLSEGGHNKIQAVIEAGVCPRLVELLGHPEPCILFPALCTVGNITIGDDVHTQVIIDHGVLPCLCNILMGNYERSIKKEACWTMSNIMGGRSDQIQAVIGSGCIEHLVWLLQNAEFDVKSEAAWAIVNAICGGTHEQIKILVGEGCIKPMCHLLRSCPDLTIMTVCLEALENILEVGESIKNEGGGGVNVFSQMIEAADGFDDIRYLLEHDNDQIYGKATDILETYLVEEEEPVDAPFN